MGTRKIFSSVTIGHLHCANGHYVLLTDIIMSEPTNSRGYFVSFINKLNDTIKV